jgi:glycerophosphoryl diester phosphodiesterase
VILFAHRGASASAPENTIAAFELALELGATGLESDVWLTADGVAVLDHDGFADDGHLVPISTVAASELPPHIPTLAELYDIDGARSVELSLDVKDLAAVDEVVRVARAAGSAERLWLCHHRWREVAQWRERAPEVRLVDSTYVGFMSGGPQQRLGQLVDAGIDALNLHHSEWTAGTPRPRRSTTDSFALAWDAQDPGSLRRLADLAVDGVFSDHVDRMVAAVGH